MRLALVIALTPDRRSGRVLSGLIPADQAISQVKQAINENACPDARFPVLRAVAVDSCLREHRFSPTAVDIAESQDIVVKPEADGIVVEIGDGNDKIIINVATEPEAEALRNLADGLKLAVEESSKAQAATIEAMKECDRLRELAKGMETANQRLATYEADLKTREARIAELEAEASTSKARIAELEKASKKK